MFQYYYTSCTCLTCVTFKNILIVHLKNWQGNVLVLNTIISHVDETHNNNNNIHAYIVLKYLQKVYIIYYIILYIMYILVLFENFISL